MRIRLALAALITLGPVSCAPPEPVDPCVIAADTSPTYAAWIRDASLDGASGQELTDYCITLLRNGY